jgi:hypothetical protein
VEHVEAEVEERARDFRVFLREVQAARADEERRDLVVQPVLLLRCDQLDRPVDCVDQVRLSLERAL